MSNKSKINRKLYENVYTPESQIRHPLKLLKSMIFDLKASRELAWRLFVRNISALYRQTALGYFWAFLPPIVITLTFVFLNKQKIFSVGETTVPYPVYVMIGTLLWQVFVDALNCPLRLVTSSKAMLTKINFPREALIIAGIYEVIFNFLIRLILLVLVMFLFKIAVPLTIFFVPLGILALIFLGLMFGILLTPLGMLYQDISKGIVMITSMWFFITPVVYPPPTSGPAALLSTINPVSAILVTTRDWITGSAATLLNQFYIVSVITIAMIIFAWLLYRIAMPHIIARIGA